MLTEDTNVLISEHGAAKARNPEVRELVWELNPYVSGFTSEPFDPKDPAGRFVLDNGEFFFRAKQLSPIEAMEFCHGFMPFYKHPKIYQNIEKKKNLENSIICDPTSISQPFTKDIFEEFVSTYIKYNRLHNYPVCLIRSPHSGNHGTEWPPSHRILEIYEAKNLIDYRRVIASCKQYLTTESGGMSLAASDRSTAMKTAAIVTTVSWNNRSFIYPDIKYYVTGKLTKDFDP